VYKDFTGQQVYYLVGRDPAVRTAYPEIFRLLLPGKLGKEIRVGLLDFLSPFLVVV
jgi:hypothetical protein